jgi:probable rRNA maturation factor
MTSAEPPLAFTHRCRAVPYDRARFESLVAAAFPQCLALAKKHNAELAILPTVEFTILGTRAMARVHRDFLGIRGATDVITFPYGEILLCAPVAAARAREFGHDTTTELTLYAIHGLLHLSGLDDTTPPTARAMERGQSKILDSVLSLVR